MLDMYCLWDPHQRMCSECLIGSNTFPALRGQQPEDGKHQKKKTEKTMRKAAKIRFIGLFVCYSILREAPMVRKMRFS